MSLPRPPPIFPPIWARILAAGRVLHRNHDRNFGPTAFNPGKGQPSRFAPFAAATGGTIPTLYAATSREAAAHETVFHDIDATDLMKAVRRSVLEGRVVSSIRTLRRLRLAPLYSPELLSWGLSRTDLIDPPKTHYDQTVSWAEAIHRADSTLDGLIWVSRRCDTHRCVMLFGDRVAQTDLQTINAQPIADNMTIMREFRRYGRRAGITIIAP